MYLSVLLLLPYVFQCNVVCIPVETSDPLNHNYYVTVTDWKAHNETINKDLMTGSCFKMGNLTSTHYKRSIIPANSKIHRKKKMKLSSFPETFDAREKFGKDCPGIRSTYNQGQCKSGWAVAVTSVISDRVCIKTGRKVTLSAQNLLSCCQECCGCNGGIILNAWYWVMNNGLVTGSPYRDKNSCMPYKIPPARPRKFMRPGFGGDWATANLAIQECPKDCRDNTDFKATKIKGFELWSKDNHLYIMEQLMIYGPLQVSMHMYEDFRYYKGGIYIHQSGKFEGEHAVKLIGWGTWKSTPYWLAINSFGNTSWGVDGTFMVPRNGKDNTKFGYAIISPILTSTSTSLKINLIKLHILTVVIIKFIYL